MRRRSQPSRRLCTARRVRVALLRHEQEPLAPLVQHADLRKQREGAAALRATTHTLAVSAVNGCEVCVQAHERVLVTGATSEAQIHDAVRIAAVVHATTIARPIGTPVAASAAA